MGTKQQMIEATAESLRRNGIAGTSFTDVLAASGAARGAIYHHFPGGKNELVEAAVRLAGQNAAAAFQGLPGQATPAGVVDAFLQLVRPIVLASTTGAGCAVAAATVETEPGSGVAVAAHEVFDSWREALVDQFVAAGAADVRAIELASLLLTTLEGAHVLCRADGSIEPFDRAAAALRAFAS